MKSEYTDRFYKSIALKVVMLKYSHLTVSYDCSDLDVFNILKHYMSPHRKTVSRY